jgi:hypothetical protein
MLSWYTGICERCGKVAVRRYLEDNSVVGVGEALVVSCLCPITMRTLYKVPVGCVVVWAEEDLCL